MKTFTTLKNVIKNAGVYGLYEQATEYTPSSYRFLRIADIKEDGSLSNDDIKYVNGKEVENYLLQENDLVISRVGSLGISYLYEPKDGPLVYIGNLIKFPLDTDKINPHYLKYFLQTTFIKKWIKYSNEGSIQRTTNRETLYNLPILELERATQDKIANVLTVIDEKVKVNSQINDNLPLLSRGGFLSC